MLLQPEDLLSHSFKRCCFHKQGVNADYNQVIGMDRLSGIAQAFTEGADGSLMLDSGDVINVSPYGNYVVTKKLTGAQIKEMLETSLVIQKNCIAANDSGEWDAWPNDSGSYLQVGGITVRFDPAQPAGARVLSVQKDGQDLDDTTVAQ